MSKAVECPVCKGKGKMMDSDFYKTEERTCHGCNGKGWVEVSE